jgi:hypothetical protein
MKYKHTSVVRSEVGYEVFLKGGKYPMSSTGSIKEIKRLRDRIERAEIKKSTTYRQG